MRGLSQESMREAAVKYRRQGIRAFTLVEMVMVLVVMATTGAIVMPRYANAIGHYRLDAAAKRIAADLNLARGQAMCSSASQGVAFNASTETYSLANMPALDNRSSNYTVNLAAEPYKVNLVSATFGNSGTVTFDGFGSPNSSGTVVVSFGTAQKTITVAAVTGKTTIQ